MQKESKTKTLGTHQPAEWGQIVFTGRPGVYHRFWRAPVQIQGINKGGLIPLGGLVDSFQESPVRLLGLNPGFR